MKTVSVLAIASMSIGAVATAQQPAQPKAAQSASSTYEQAVVAWQRGDYPEALEGLIRVLSAEGQSYLSQIALLTGELYRTTEIAADGRAVRWSPDGRFAAFEIGMGRSAITKVLDMTSQPKVVAELRGSGLVFSRDGQRAAYLASGDSAG